MNKATKIIGIVAAVLLVLVIVLVIAIRLVVTPERIKTVLLPKAAEALGREVTLGALDISLFSGITLTDLVVQEREKGPEPFISAGRVVLRYQFWPLLQRRVVVDEVRLEAPRIRVERFNDGTFNFSDLPERFRKEKEPDRKEAVDLLVSTVQVTGGVLLFLDHKAGDPPPYRLQLSGFDFSSRNISPESPFPWEMKARLGEGTVSASGKLHPKEISGEVRAKVEGVSLLLFAPYFGDKLPGHLNTAFLNLDLSAEGGKQGIGSKGTLGVDGIDLVLRKKNGEQIPLRNATVGIEYSMTADLAAKSMHLKNSTVTFNRLPISASGTVHDFTGERRLDLQVVLPKIDLRPTLVALPPGVLPAAVAQLDPGGKISGNVRLAGSAAQGKKLLQRGEVQLEAVEVNAAKGRVALDGVLELAGDTVTSKNLQVRMGENSATVDLKAWDLFGDIIRVTSSLRADRFALDPLLRGSAAAGGAPPAREEKKNPKESMKPPLRAEGTVQIGQTVYKGLTLQNFSLSYLFDRGVLTVSQMTGRMAGGSFRSQARLDLGQPSPPFSVSLDLQGFQAEPLVNAFFPKAAGTVFGTLNLNARFQGTGLEPPSIKRTLSGQGGMVIRDGQLTGAGLIKGLAEFLNLEELRVLRFSQVKGSFTARNGKLEVDSDIAGQNVRMHPQGTVALENYGIDLALQPLFSPELTRKLDARGTVTRFLVDEQGWGNIPLKAGGTLGSPRFIIDTAAMQEKVKERAGQELRKRINKGLEQAVPRKKEEAAPGGAQEQGRKVLEDTLRGLIGK